MRASSIGAGVCARSSGSSWTRASFAGVAARESLDKERFTAGKVESENKPKDTQKKETHYRRLALLGTYRHDEDLGGKNEFHKDFTVGAHVNTWYL